MGRDAAWIPAALVVVVALAAPARSSLAQAPAPERSASEKPPAPRVLLIAGEEGDADDFEVAASAFAHLLVDRHGMTTTQVRAHSAEIGRAADALAGADVAIFFVRYRTWPEPERRKVGDFVARGGRAVDLRAEKSESERRTSEEPRVLALTFDDTSSLLEEKSRRLVLRWILPSLDRKPSDPFDLAVPDAVPLTAFEVSTAYVSDWSQPITKQVFPPEEGIGGFNDVQWIPVKSADGSLDLRRFDPTSKQGTIYVKSKLTVKGKRDLELVLQSDDGLEVFVDGKKRASRQEVRTLHTGCDLVPVTLEDGEHGLMLKVMNAGDAWAVRARVRDLTAYRAEKPK
jgi:hypothetical protein